MIIRNSITEVACNVHTTVDAKNNLTLDYKVTNENDSKAMGPMLRRAKKIWAMQTLQPFMIKELASLYFAKSASLQLFRVLTLSSLLSSHFYTLHKRPAV
jgi:hypothetical protein